MTLRILLVEDSRVLAERLRESLDGLDNVEVVGAVVDESSAVAAATEQDVDVIVLDLQLKEGTGFGVVQRLGKARPTIIVFTNYTLPEYQRLAATPFLRWTTRRGRRSKRRSGTSSGAKLSTAGRSRTAPACRSCASSARRTVMPSC